MTAAPGELSTLGTQPLLVMLDYDGTLAPIAPAPEEALPAPGTREALAALLAGGRHLPRVLSGRPREQVQAFLHLPDLPVIGLHGLEWPGEPLPQEYRAGVAQLLDLLPDFPGRRVEDKGVTLAVHYRATPDELIPQVEAQLGELPLPGGWALLHGKRVAEFRPQGVHKGTAILRLAQEAPRHMPVYLGDDLTDEDAFQAVNGLGGVSVKVGEGQTQATQRIQGPDEVARLLLLWSQL